MSVAIRRHPEAMYLNFADLPYEVSLEFADNFVADFSPDDDIRGLEILWEDSERAGSEPAMLAFGVFGSALTWLGYHYAACSGPEMRRAALRKAKQFISAVGLEAPVAVSGATGLTIADAGGNALLCADFQYHPRRIFQSAKYAPAAEMAEIHAAIKRLTQTVLPANPGAVGVAVAVDETAHLQRHPPVAPGLWRKWPAAAGNLRAHIAIIPPHDRAYPWLPQHFLDFPA